MCNRAIFEATSNYPITKLLNYTIALDLRPPTRHHRLRHRPAPAAAPRRTAQRRPHRRRSAAARTFAGHHPRPQWKTENIVASPELLAQRGVEVFECDRGGDVTFHGPGQLVGYPIFDLRGIATPDGKRKTLGAIEYVRRLEEVLIRTCADFGIPDRPYLRPDRRLDKPANPVIPRGAEQFARELFCGVEGPCVPHGSKNRRHRRPHLPRRHLARFRPQREHRSRLFQPDHSLRHHGQAGDFHGQRIEQGTLATGSRPFHLPQLRRGLSKARCSGWRIWMRCWETPSASR